MAFKKEIQEFLNPFKVPFRFKYTIIDCFGGYFENVLKIGEISTYSVTLLLKCGVVKVVGNNLMVVKYCDGDLAIKGDILKVERCN